MRDATRRRVQAALLELLEHERAEEDLRLAELVTSLLLDQQAS